MVKDRLSPCPESPNCVCSEDYKNKNIQPLSIFEATADEAWLNLQSAIKESGGTIHTLDSDYLWATFSTSFFMFIDDVEARLDRQNQVIHLRSASRVGYSDFGANQRRVYQIRKTFLHKFGSTSDSQ